MADFNKDSSVDPDDLADYISCFFSQATSASACPKADLDGDGLTKPDDLADFITYFFLGC